MESKLLLLVLMLISPFVWSHKSSDSFMNLQVNNQIITAQWDIALRDLEYALGLDYDGNGEITWVELRSRFQEIKKYAFSSLQIKNDGKVCLSQSNKLQAGQLQVNHHSDGAYAVLNFNLNCASAINQFGIEYQLFFDIDPTHRGLVQISKDGSDDFVIFSPENQQANINFSNFNQWQTLHKFVIEGIWHIWIGYDHILFLLCLLLPSVVKKTANGWVQNNDFSDTVRQIGKIVTAFTIAHSITLLLTILQWVNLPSRWVESAIAFSVLLAAVNNLYPFFSKRVWLVAFTFGLIHGFGFASILSNLALTVENLGVSLIGFNLGIEIGQLVIVSIFLPIAYLLRRHWFYQRVILYTGSQFIILVALVWFLQRAFDISIFTV